MVRALLTASDFRARLAWAIVLILFAVSLHQGRKSFISSFFGDGSPGDAPGLTMPEESAGLGATTPLRVVLIDGLSATAAHALPHFNERCRTAADLHVDNGFPTVSLPVQHVLWTGLTQSQSGVRYRVGELEAPPKGSLPGAVPGSVAVAESHPEIIRSFGFEMVLQAEEGSDDADGIWRASEFLDAASRAVAGPSRLAFIHILRVDEAGHAHGGNSTEYAQAAAWADDAVDRLWREAQGTPGADATWLVLSDHGHRDEGGHGGAEPAIRFVRACVWGPGLDLSGLPPGRTLHLVDVSRFLFDALGVTPVSAAAGRPLAFALEHADPKLTLPSPGGGRRLLAALALLGAAFGTYLLRPGASGWPWWALVAYAGVTIAHGNPSLSVPAMYPPLGRDLALAAAPGLGVAVLQAGWGVRRRPPAVVAGSLLMLPAGLLAALFALCAGAPPLMPRSTAETSVWLIITATGAVAVALAIALTPARRGPRAA